MSAKTIKIPTFDELYEQAPKELKVIVDKFKDIQQSKNWHPEGNLEIHERIVYNRAKRTGDMTMAVAAFFHDTGKVESTKFIPPAKYSSHGHEFASLRLVEKYKLWIESLDADYDIVHYIVKNHMRAKQIHQMKRTKREAFMKDKYFPLVNDFSKFDDMQTLSAEDYDII